MNRINSMLFQYGAKTMLWICVLCSIVNIHYVINFGIDRNDRNAFSMHTEVPYQHHIALIGYFPQLQ